MSSGVGLVWFVNRFGNNYLDTLVMVEVVVVVRDSESSSYRDGRTSVKKKLMRRFVGYLSTRILSAYGNMF